MEFAVIDEPPLKVRTHGGDGYLIDNDCGDCADYMLLVGRPGQIARIGWVGDDRQPNLRRLLCEMRTVALTFNWASGSPPYAPDPKKRDSAIRRSARIDAPALVLRDHQHPHRPGVFAHTAVE